MSTAPTLAVCGIDCTACDIYRAVQSPEAAEKLAASWRAGGNTQVTADWFKCKGCFSDRTDCWCDDCKIYVCSAGKGLENCSQCADFPCDTYQAWIGPYTHHRKALERLQALRDKTESLP